MKYVVTMNENSKLNFFLTATWRVIYINLHNESTHLLHCGDTQ